VKIIETITEQDAHLHWMPLLSIIERQEETFFILRDGKFIADLRPHGVWGQRGRPESITWPAKRRQPAERPTITLPGKSISQTVLEERRHDRLF